MLLSMFRNIVNFSREFPNVHADLPKLCVLLATSIVSLFHLYRESGYLPSVSSTWSNIFLRLLFSTVSLWVFFRALVRDDILGCFSVCFAMLVASCWTTSAMFVLGVSISCSSYIVCCYLDRVVILLDPYILSTPACSIGGPKPDRRPPISIIPGIGCISLCVLDTCKGCFTNLAKGLPTALLGYHAYLLGFWNQSFPSY